MKIMDGVTLLLSSIVLIQTISIILLSPLNWFYSLFVFPLFIIAFISSYRRQRNITKNNGDAPKTSFSDSSLEILLLFIQVIIFGILLSYSLMIFTTTPDHITILASGALLVGLFNILALGEYVAKTIN